MTDERALEIRDAVAAERHAAERLTTATPESFPFLATTYVRARARLNELVQES